MRWFNLLGLMCLVLLISSCNICMSDQDNTGFQFLLTITLCYSIDVCVIYSVFSAWSKDVCCGLCLVYGNGLRPHVCSIDEVSHITTSEEEGDFRQQTHLASWR